VIHLLRKSLLSLVAVSFVATAFGQTQRLLTRHVRSAVIDGQAKSLGPMSPSQTMRIVLVLPLRNQAQLDTLLQDLYTPGNPSYHQFLTVEQFTAQFGPTQDDYNAVINFAEEHGLRVVATSPNRVNLDVTGTVGAINRALHVTMTNYQHPTENRTFFSPDREPTVDLPFQLWHVAGLENYSLPHPAGLSKRPDGSHAKSGATTGSGPSASFLGSDMRAAYYGSGSLNGSGQYLGLLEFYGTDLSDLETYYSNAGQTYPGSKITLLSTDGTSTSCTESSGCDDTEQTLDMTQALGMAPGLTGLVMFVGSTDSAIFESMATRTPLNNELSCSWGWSPEDASTDDPYFEEFAAQGQNLFVAAGDSGKWSSSQDVYPADDVYITSVGGTDLTTSSAAGPWASETVWSDGGGGISPDKFAIPSWQTTAASSCSSCSKTYRNGPDVSANANFTFYVCADQTTCTANEYGGTSFAAPMWAGFLALTNQQSVANGNKALGFINPSLYTIGEGSSYDSDLHDITSGSNGYSATTGYDLASGWGSPQAALISALAGSTSTSPGFSLSASPGSVSVAAGSSGSSTITSTVTGGFDSAVTLSSSGAPSGVTVTFSPTSITGSGSSTMSIAVASTVAAGTYAITVTGTSGSTKETTAVSLTVTTTASGSFSLSVSPSSGYLDLGQSGYAVVTSKVSGGFDAAVSFSASGVPSGVTYSFSPSSLPAPGSGTTDFNLTVSRSAETGSYTITITGTGGGKTATTTLDFQIRR
jgi:subtilase family serine protease